MRFSIYSELQSWPGRSYDRLYGEVLEQIENADRLGYETYAAIEHLFFPKFSASANVFGLFGMAAARTRNIKFRTMLHILPYHNPLDLAAKHGWAVAVPPLLPYATLKDQLDLYRAKCGEYGTTPDIIWIHAAYIDEDRELAKREAEQHMRGFLAGNASPLTEHTPPPA